MKWDGTSCETILLLFSKGIWVGLMSLSGEEHLRKKLQNQPRAPGGQGRWNVIFDTLASQEEQISGAQHS